MIYVFDIHSDPARPRLHKTLSLDNRAGLSNLLSGNLRLDEMTQSIDIPGLTVVTSGPIPPNPSELLGSSALADFVEWLRDNGDYDHVLFDCAPVLTVTDAVLLSTRVDSTILLARAGVTARDALRQSVARMRELRINLTGVVLNAAVEDALGQKAEKNMMDMQPGDVPATYADVDALESARGIDARLLEEGIERLGP